MPNPISHDNRPLIFRPNDPGIYLADVLSPSAYIFLPVPTRKDQNNHDYYWLVKEPTP